MSASSSSSSSASNYLFNLVWLGAALYGAGFFLYYAYRIRLLAIEEYGPVIHEFDPYFNYRATEYLYHNGREKFLKWFDYMVWYPLGRPVGTTIYPGMQFTAVFLKNHIFGDRMSLNDVCCYMPAWFGTLASFVVGCLAYECALPQNSNSSVWRFLVDIVKGKRSEPEFVSQKKMLGLTSPAVECGVFAMGLMGVVPAHLMRSVGGGYDNESVAVSAMSLTFYFWVRSLRNGERYSFFFGALAGVAYFYMVAAWGGYVFVLNMIGLHAALLVIFGRFSTKVYASYSLFYVIGTALAIQVPVVGWTPLKSLEQLGPCAVFLGFQVLQFCEIIKRKRKLSRGEAWKLRIQVFSIAAVLGIVFVWLLAPSGYFGPISSRVRGLFVKHTKTGNPLVDSVAEHQAASSKAYFQYLQHLCTIAPIGYITVMFNLSDSSSFLLAWGATAYFFSHKMVRLVLLLGPIASALSGVVVGRVFSWCVRQLWDDDSDEEVGEDIGVGGGKKKKSKKGAIPTATPAGGGDKAGGENGKQSETKKSKKSIKKKGGAASSDASSFSGLSALNEGIRKASKSKEGIFMKRALSCILLILMYLLSLNFKTYCWRLAAGLSNPTIIMKGQTRDGTVVVVDDYREAYWWLRDNTPEDARVMAWWDYGYQIAGIANRTTIADGNTWNHEHIALLGRALTSSEEEGYEIAKHLADYVLIWGGGGGDDLAKSPHLARIANSVYRDMCPGDPTCRSFGFVDRVGTPSPMMEKSFLYRLHGHGIKPGVTADPAKFREVYRSKYGKVRIYKILGVSEESKHWVSDPKNRVCDVEGSWFCPGQYPPALQSILAAKKDFAQLEDFNRGDADEDYQKQYFEALQNPELAKARARAREIQDGKNAPSEQGGTSDGGGDGGGDSSSASKPPPPTKEQIEEVYNKWEDTEETTLMWQIVSSNSVTELQNWIDSDPLAPFVRSADGRGPMWWAFENRNQEIVKVLMKAGLGHTDKDKYGKTPVDLLESSK